MAIGRDKGKPPAWSAERRVVKGPPIPMSVPVEATRMARPNHLKQRRGCGRIGLIAGVVVLGASAFVLRKPIGDGVSAVCEKAELGICWDKSAEEPGPIASSAVYPSKANPNQMVGNLATFTIKKEAPLKVDPGTGDIGVGIDMDINAANFNLLGMVDREGKPLNPDAVTIKNYLSGFADENNPENSYCTQDVRNAVEEAQAHAKALVVEGSQLTAADFRDAENVYTLPPYGAKDDTETPNVYVWFVNTKEDGTTEELRMDCVSAEQRLEAAAEQQG